MKVMTAVLLLLGGAAVHAAPVERLWNEYRAEGAAPFDAERGARLWVKTHPGPDGESRSCATCHGEDLRRAGRHAVTGKPIGPLAPASDPARLADERDIRKWLLRNCKWTLGRPCSAREKGDFLAFIRSR